MQRLKPFFAVWWLTWFSLTAWVMLREVAEEYHLPGSAASRSVRGWVRMQAGSARLAPFCPAHEVAHRKIRRDFD